MKRAHRPVPIQVPAEGDTAAANFKLTDSGVWSEGGLVFSTAGCIIDKGKAQSGTTGAPSQPSKQLYVGCMSQNLTLLCPVAGQLPKCLLKRLDMITKTGMIPITIRY
jgi:hypothetical protein